MSNCSDGSCSTDQGQGDGSVSQEDYQKVAEQNQYLKKLAKELADDRNGIIRKNKADYTFANILVAAIVIGFFLWIYLR